MSTYLLIAASGDKATTPDIAALRLIGHLTIDVLVNLDNYTFGTIQTLVSKRTASGEFVARLLATTGKLNIAGNDSAGAVSAQSTVAPTVTNGNDIWLRFERDAGSGGNFNNNFYTSADGATFGTAVGTNPVAATSTDDVMVATTNLVSIGDSVTSGTPAKGKIKKVRIYDASDVLIANPDFTIQTPGATSFVDSTGLTWTIAGAASIAGTVDTPGRQSLSIGCGISM